MLSVSATTPCPAKAASPWMSTGSTGWPAGALVLSGRSSILQGPGHPLDDRVDRLEMGRVGGERHVDASCPSGP